MAVILMVVYWRPVIRSLVSANVRIEPPLKNVISANKVLILQLALHMI